MQITVCFPYAMSIDLIPWFLSSGISLQANKASWHPGPALQIVRMILVKRVDFLRSVATVPKSLLPSVK